MYPGSDRGRKGVEILGQVVTKGELMSVDALRLMLMLRNGRGNYEEPDQGKWREEPLET